MLKQELFVRNSDVVKALDEPPRLRDHGFYVSAGTSRIEGARLRRAALSDWRKVLDAWEDGVLIFAEDAGFLSWWSNPPRDGSIWINPLVLFETTHSFISLSCKVFARCKPVPERFEFGIGIRHAIVDGKPISLSPGGLDPFGLSGAHRARSPNFESEPILCDKPIDPDQISYRLRQPLYRWFGLGDNDIPYRTAEEVLKTVGRV